MKLFLDGETYFDTNEPIDISIHISDENDAVRAWYVNPPTFEPVRTDNYVGSVEEGGVVNFRDIYFNPHGHGTHTECLGHITKEVYSVNQVLKQYFFSATLISVSPIEIKTASGKFDHVITVEQLKESLQDKACEALIIRTLPNPTSKKSLNYSATNPPYFDVDCVAYLDEIGVKHLLVDLPSVDREEDGGLLLFHHAFWQVPENPQHDKTITEFVYVDDAVKDGNYVLELQMAAFENDASPSRPVLYKQKKD